MVMTLYLFLFYFIFLVNSNYNYKETIIKNAYNESIYFSSLVKFKLDFKSNLTQ